jgi:hypothetical protein
MARYNTAPQTLEVTGETEFTYAFTGGIITLSGTPGYTVTMVSPVFFPGSRQTFYNATADTITLETAAGQIVGNGVTIGTEVDIPTNSTYQLTSDGTNYVLTSALAGTTVFELPVTFNDVLNADAKVELNPLDANVEIKPTGSGLVDISPQSSVSIQPGAQATIRPTGNLILSSSSGTVSLGDIGKTTSFPGNIEFTANNQTVNISPTGTGSVTINPGGDVDIDAGGQLTITSSTLGTITNMSIGSSNPSTGAFTSLTAGGSVTLTANAASSSTTSGTLIVTGGIGASGAIYAGSLQGTPIGSSTRSTGAFTNLTSNGDVTLTKNVASTNTTTGTLVVSGGVGVAGAIHAGSIQNTPIGSSTRSSGLFTTFGANSTANFTATTEATSADSGAVQIDGGLGVNKRIYSGGGFQGAIGNVSRSTGAFTTLTANSTVTLSPGANVTISPTGSGTVTLSPAGGGSINNMSIGATTASTGRFTSGTFTSNVSISGTLGVNGNVTLGNATSDSVDINGSLTVDNGFNHNSTGGTRVARGTNAQRPSGLDGYIRYNTDIDCMEFSDGTTWRSLGPGFLYSDVTSNITAAVWRCYFVDTNGGARTITLPNSGLIKGDTIRFFDLRKTFDSNNLIVNPNGGRIQGDTGNMTVNTEGAAFELVYHSSTYGWRIFSI